MSENNYEYYMDQAIGLAKQAESLGEVPIGAIVVKEGIIIGRGYNLRETAQDPTGHAEMMAIKDASRSLGAWRLLDCTLYVTLEPCPMCAGAIVQSRIPHVVYGTFDPKAGCAGTLLNLLQEKRFNHQVNVVSGIRADQCAELLRQFFRKLRK